MTKTTTKDRVKKFVKDHENKILAVVTLAATAAIVIREVDKAQTKKAIAYGKADATWVASENAWLYDIYSNGKKAYYLHDETYAVMPEDTKVEWIKDRPKRP